MKRLLSIALVLALLPAGALAAEPGLENFKREGTYIPGQFTDVPAGAWYEPHVKEVYELGLMTGASPSAFGAGSGLSIAQTLVAACNLYGVYHTGEAASAPTDPWYQFYVDYALDHGIIAAGEYSDYGAAATRAQFASILAAALPEEALPAINTIDSIPDVDAASGYAQAVYRLYRAGVVSGVNEAGEFRPDSGISRAEASVIIANLADASRRTTFTLHQSGGEKQPEVSSGGEKAPGESTPAPQLSFYEMYPDVPDFGAFAGVAAAEVVDEGSACGYLYASAEVNARLKEDKSLLSRYYELLQAQGFEPISKYQDDDGGDQVLFYRDPLAVSLGNVRKDGKIYFSVSVLSM